MAHSTSFDENGRPVLTTDFDWDSVEQNLNAERKQIRRLIRRGDLTDEHFEMAIQLCGTLFRWVWQNGKRDERGLCIRSIIACWFFLPELHDEPMTKIAKRFGRFKQSLGRWVEHKEDGFNATFPRWRIAPNLNARAIRTESDRKEAELLLAHHQAAGKRLCVLLENAKSRPAKKVFQSTPG